MEEWYRQQDFFTEARLNKIKAWKEQEVLDLFSYTMDGFGPRLAAS